MNWRAGRRANFALAGSVIINGARVVKAGFHQATLITPSVSFDCDC